MSENLENRQITEIELVPAHVFRKSCSKSFSFLAYALKRWKPGRALFRITCDVTISTSTFVDDVSFWKDTFVGVLSNFTLVRVCPMRTYLQVEERGRVCVWIFVDFFEAVFKIVVPSVFPNLALVVAHQFRGLGFLCDCFSSSF